MGLVFDNNKRSSSSSAITNATFSFPINRLRTVIEGRGRQRCRCRCRRPFISITPENIEFLQSLGYNVNRQIINIRKSSLR